MRALLKPLRLVVDALVADASPRQLSAGIALGLLAGLVPKGNLTAAALLVLIASLKINLAAIALATALFSCVGVWLDPWSDRLGEWALTAPALQSTWVWLSRLPIVPWTAFNNTVVLGSLMIGIVAVYPAYRLLVWPASRCLPAVQRRLEQFRVVRMLRGAEWGEKIHSAAPSR